MQRPSGPKKGQAEFCAEPGKASTKQDQQASTKKIYFSKILSSIGSSASPLFSKSKSLLYDEWKIFLFYKTKFSLGSNLYIHNYIHSFTFHISPKFIPFLASLEALTLHSGKFRSELCYQLCILQGQQGQKVQVGPWKRQD